MVAERQAVDHPNHRHLGDTGRDRYGGRYTCTMKWLL